MIKVGDIVAYDWRVAEVIGIHAEDATRCTLRYVGHADAPLFHGVLTACYKDFVLIKHVDDEGKNPTWLRRPGGGYTADRSRAAAYPRAKALELLKTKSIAFAGCVIEEWQVKETTHWCYSTDEERYHGHFDSFEAALDDATSFYFEEGDEDIPDVFIGKVREVKIKELLPSIDWLIEKMLENADEIVGEVAENGLKGIDDKGVLERLEAGIVRVFEDNGVVPLFWAVDGGERVKYEASVQQWVTLGGARYQRSATDSVIRRLEDTPAHNPEGDNV